MRRAAEESRKAETPKRFELTPGIIYLLIYNGAQAFGLVIALVQYPLIRHDSRDPEILSPRKSIHFDQRSTSAALCNLWSTLGPRLQCMSPVFIVPSCFAKC